MKKTLIFVLSLVMLTIFAVGCSTDPLDSTTATAASTVEATTELTAAPEVTAESTATVQSIPSAARGNTDANTSATTKK